MNVPKVDIKQLLEAGVHLGHKTLRWNPKMKKYIFGEKNSIHIIDLTQTVDFLKSALVQVHKIIANGGKLLVVSTKKQASEAIARLLRYNYAVTAKPEGDDLGDDLGGDLDTDLGGDLGGETPTTEPAGDDTGIPATVDDL